MSQDKNLRSSSRGNIVVPFTRYDYGSGNANKKEVDHVELVDARENESQNAEKEEKYAN